MVVDGAALLGELGATRHGRQVPGVRRDGLVRCPRPADLAAQLLELTFDPHVPAFGGQPVRGPAQGPTLTPGVQALGERAGQHRHRADEQQDDRQPDDGHRVVEHQYREEPDGGYQVQQAKIAMANGEWFGLGPGNSIQRNYLPSPYSDFIYAIVVEEYGIFTGMLIILLYVLLFFRATRLVTKSPKAFGAMLAIGLSISMVLQAFINIAVSVHLVPVTGVTLPMISMGGTSILFTCISFGIILSVSKYIESVS